MRKGFYLELDQKNPWIDSINIKVVRPADCFSFKDDKEKAEFYDEILERRGCGPIRAK